MSITDYFSKLRSVNYELVIAGSLISFFDFFKHLIPGLGQNYYPIVVDIEANVLKISVNEGKPYFGS